MNNALSISRVARLYEVLTHVKSFPTQIKPVAIIAGIEEEEIRNLLAPSLYIVIDDHIQHINAIKNLECVTIGDADFLYLTNGVATYVKDGRPAWLHVDSYEDGPCNSVDWQVLRLGLRLEYSDRAGGEYSPGLLRGDYITLGEELKELNQSEGITSDRDIHERGLYQALGRLDLLDEEAPPITAEAVQRFFREVRKKAQHYQVVNGRVVDTSQIEQSPSQQ